MCSIGAVFAAPWVYVYKQCDLTVPRQFFDPVPRRQALPYHAMTRQGRPGLWAGVNGAVSFVAADAYTNLTYDVPDDAVGALFQAYEVAVGNGRSAREAADLLERFYRSGYAGGLFPGPDIALFADRREAIFIEFTPGPNRHDPVREVVVSRGFFASTNHFRVQPDAVIYGANRSTYLRLARAETILERSPDRDGILSVLTDRYYGKSELSICRAQQYPGEYFTQATALFGLGPSGAQTLEYQINGDPLDQPLKPFPLPPL